MMSFPRSDIASSIVLAVCAYSGILPYPSILDSLVQKCEIDGNRFKILSKSIPEWDTRLNEILERIDPKILTFGPHPTHPQLSSCEGLI